MHLVNAIASMSEKYEIVGFDNINDYYDVRVKYGRLHETGIKADDIPFDQFFKSEKYSNYRFIRLNLEDRDAVEKLFRDENFDIVCNLAAQAGVRYSLENPHAYIQSNIVGFLNLLECCRHNHIEHFVYASSSSVYGLNESQPFSTTDCVNHPVSLYAASKKSNELMAHSYSHLYNLPTTGLRFFTVYGPWGRPDMAPILFTDAILNNRPIKVFNNGDMERDFTYIDDINEGVVRILEKPAEKNSLWKGKNPDPSSSSCPYKIYNIGNNKPEKLMDFITAIEKKLEKKAEKKFLPMQLGDVVSTCANIDQLIEEVGYTPNTPMTTGIDKFIDWYKNFYKV